MATRIVEQWDQAGCVVASLAMYLDREYSEIRDLCTSHIHDQLQWRGLEPHEILKLSSLLGIKFRMRTGKPRGRAILVVKCPASLHAVYYDGLNVLDPQLYHATTELYLKRTKFYFTERRFL